MGRNKRNPNKPRKQGRPAGSGGKGAGASTRARNALRESEARFRATFEQAAVGVAHTTTEGRFLQANGKLCQMLGYSAAELRALTTRELTHNDDRDKHDALRLELLAGRRTSYAIEKRFLHRDGAVIWVNRTVMLARRPSRNEPYLIQVIEDISERKATEARVQRLMRARRVMAECTHVLIHAVDETRMLEDMCRILVESGGYKMAWVGFPTGDAGGGIRAVAHAGFGDDAPMSAPGAWSANGRYQGFMWDVITTGNPHVARNILEDPAHRRRRARALQHHFQSSIGLPLHGDGAIIGAAAIYAREAEAFDADEIGLLSELVADIAYGIVNLRTRIAREQAELRSRESEQRFRETFEQAAVGITRVDLSGVLVDMNQKFCDMLGYGKEELLGRHIKDITHPDDYGVGSQYRSQLAYRAMKTAAGEKRFVRKDGTALWARRTMSTACDTEGRPLYVISVVEDISERKELEREFQDTFDQAAMGIAHTSVDGIYLRANRKLCEMVGYSESELIGRRGADLMHPDDRGSGPETRRLMLEGKLGGISEEKRYFRKDGSMIWMNRTISLARDASGKPKYFIRIFEDITERKQIETDRAQLAAIVETSNDAIISRGLDRKILTWNPAAERLFGWTAQEAIGQSILLIVPPERRNENAHRRELVHQGIPVPAYDTQRLTRDGRRIDVALSQSAIRDKRGEVVAVSLVFHDITQRKEMERRFELTFSHAAVGMTLAGVDGRFIQVNRKFGEMLGYTKEELAGTSSIDLTHPEDRADTFASREKLLNREIESASGEKRLIRRDGRVIWANRTFSMARGAAGEPVCFITVVEDITERKDFERRYRETFDQAAVGIVHTSAEGRYLRVNQKFCDMLGYSEAELVGGMAADFTHPEDRDKGADSRRRLWNGEIDKLAEERRYVRKDGRIVWTNRTVSLARDAAGSPMYFIRVIEDITDRKEVEQRYRATFDNAPVGIMHTALDNYRILHANRKLCEMLGYTPEDLLEKTSTDIVHPDYRFSDKSSYMDQLLEGKVQSFASERLFVRKDGAPLWVNRTVSLVRDMSGNPQYFIRVIEDISERKQAEAAVARERQLLRTIIDTLPDFVYVKDAIGRFQLGNEAWLKARGLSAEEIVGKTVFDFFPREIAENMAAEDALVVLTGQAKSDYESRLILADRDGRRREQWSSTTKAPMRDASGAIIGTVGVSRDISKRKRAEAALRESEEQFRQLAGNIPEVFWITDVGHRETIYISPAAAILTGRPVQELCASPREMIRAVHPEDRRRVYEARKAAAGGGYDQTYRVVRPDGTTRWVNDRAFAVSDEAGNVYRIAGITEDVTERKLAEERLTQLAHYDVLTDLPNRVLFYDRLRQVLAQAKRSQWTVGVMFVDLDRFKNVNDTLGHAVGDQLLRQVSERLAHAVRSGDTVGRLGGDEFAIVLSNLSNAQDASLVAQKIMASFNEPFKLHGADFYVTASIGVTLYPDDAEDQDTLIKNADAAMYRAKDIGRNTYQFYRSEMNERALELLSMESHMRRALDRDEFLLHYQPKASIRDGAIVGVEALLRWQHPERGLMAPAAFLPVLEETGLIVRVGERVLNAACRQIKAWQGAGIKVVPVAINLSAREFAARDLVGVITRILREHDVDPALIELEITEGSLMVSTEEVVGTLEALGRLGIGLSIDDFGTGYSSLSYLKRFPLDAVKIDRSFVKDVTTDADDATITRAVISMAHSLGLKVIAEGVETESQLGFLAQHGCDEIQGYYFAHPLAADECGIWLREQRRLGQPGVGPRNLVAMR